MVCVLRSLSLRRCGMCLKVKISPSSVPIHCIGPCTRTCVSRYGVSVYFLSLLLLHRFSTAQGCVLSGGKGVCVSGEQGCVCLEHRGVCVWSTGVFSVCLEVRVRDMTLSSELLLLPLVSHLRVHIYLCECLFCSEMFYY